MATLYSNLFTGLNATTATNINGTSATKRQSTQGAHARLRTSIGHIRIDNGTSHFTTADVAHMFLLKPNDRLVRLLLTCDDSGTAGTLDIGLYEVEERDGAYVFTVSDADLFTNDLAINASATSWTDVMHQSTTVPIEYIGKEMWEIADLGAGNYTSATNKLFAISLTPASNTTADDIDFVLVAEYIAGD